MYTWIAILWGTRTRWISSWRTSRSLITSGRARRILNIKELAFIKIDFCVQKSKEEIVFFKSVSIRRKKDSLSFKQTNSFYKIGRYTSNYYIKPLEIIFSYSFKSS